jgi:hypothetical protein
MNKYKEQIVMRKNVRYEHTEVGMGNKQLFWEPQRVVLLNENSACGHCPATFVCHNGNGWSSLCKEFIFATCDRCFAFGMRQLNSDTLYVCTLLRNNRMKKRWECNPKARTAQAYAIFENILRFEFAPSLKDIPFSCAARCRYREILHMNRLNDTLDCRTTISDAISNVVRY